MAGSPRSRWLPLSRPPSRPPAGSGQSPCSPRLAPRPCLREVKPPPGVLIPRQRIGGWRKLLLIGEIEVLRLAERGGFEPPVPVTQDNCLAGSPDRPLQHLSVPSRSVARCTCFRQPRMSTDVPAPAPENSVRWNDSVRLARGGNDEQVCVD
jgi:hypothetical protein